EVLPVAVVGNTLTLAMSDPTNLLALDDVAFMTNMQVMPLVASQAAIREAIERAYKREDFPIVDLLNGFADDAAIEVVEDSEASKIDVFELQESADQPPTVRLVNMVLADAI